jgi:WhiB family transcriptional regulator, redox-sensing transcriptional regulator
VSHTFTIRSAVELDRLDGPVPCQVQPADLWFSEVPAQVEAAKAHCLECPIRAACLAGALERAEPYGVWGGELLQRGRVVPRKRGRGRPRKRPADQSSRCARSGAKAGTQTARYSAPSGSGVE